jgi:gamma-polyglutamate biosynthesis protein CapA
VSESDSDALTICVVGDISLGDSPKMIGIGVRSATQQKGGSFLFAQARKMLQADLVIGNLEGVLSDAGFDPHRLRNAQLRGQPSMAKELKSAGFTVLNVANNHMMQYGPEPFKETCKLLANQSLCTIGVKGISEFHSQPLRLTHKNYRIGILGYADPDCYGFHPLYAMNHPHMVLEDVERLRHDVDFLIVSLHWGDEFVRCPSPMQRTYARSIAWAGADLIVGHHPHVIQRLERCGSAWIVYSLGNFVSDMVWNPRTKEGLTAIFRLSNKGIDLTALYQIDIGNNFAPMPVPVNLDSILAHVAEDETNGSDECAYKELVSHYRKNNRNLAHIHLMKNILSFDMSIYGQLWADTLKRALGLNAHRENASETHNI